VDAAPAGETEALVFDPRTEFPTWALRVSDAEGGALGEYSIRPRPYENRSSVSAGNSQRGFLRSKSTKRDSPDGISVYFREHDLEGLSPGRRTYLTVVGNSGCTAQFAIADINQGSYKATGSTRYESDATVSSASSSGNAYKLLVAGLETDFNGDFAIALAHQPPRFDSIFSSERFSLPRGLSRDLFGPAPPPPA